MRKPKTNAVPSYAYKVMINGQTGIATLQGFNVTFNRELQRVRELGNIIDDIVEIVPGRGDFTISLERLETYSANFAQALGFTPTTNLSTVNGIDSIVPSNQILPFDIIESISDFTSINKRTITYSNCWIQSYSKSVREGTLLVVENLTVWPTAVTVTKG